MRALIAALAVLAGLASSLLRPGSASAPVRGVSTLEVSESVALEAVLDGELSPIERFSGSDDPVT